MAVATAPSHRQQRYQRARERLAQLEPVIEQGGNEDLRGWSLREEVLQTVERLPRREQDAWKERWLPKLRSVCEEAS